MFQIETSSGRVGHRAMKTSASSRKPGRRRGGHDGRRAGAARARCSRNSRCSRCSMEWRSDQDRRRRLSMTCARGENAARPPCSFHLFTPWRGPLTPAAPHPQTRRRAPPDARRRAPPTISSSRRTRRRICRRSRRRTGPRIIQELSRILPARAFLFVSPRTPKLYDGTRPLGCPSRVFIRATTHFSHERGKDDQPKNDQQGPLD